ncbi:MAG: DUF1572 family protein [Flavobacteriales bacterium]|nr:DUF1572 family protein [Flavobacteriales bacterium]
MTLKELKFIHKLFEYYKGLGDAVLERCTEAQLSFTINRESNSIAIIVKHLSGNMLSRWTDFLESDGEKDWRDRDDEFENFYGSKTELAEIWEKGWRVFLNALSELKEEDIQKTVYIRNEGHSVPEAIQRQLAHYAYHVGQMVFLAKTYSDNWDSLSIPRNKSADFNKEKFLKEKKKGTFLK